MEEQHRNNIANRRVPADFNLIEAINQQNEQNAFDDLPILATDGFDVVRKVNSLAHNAPLEYRAVTFRLIAALANGSTCGKKWASQALTQYANMIVDERAQAPDWNRLTQMNFLANQHIDGQDIQLMRRMVLNWAQKLKNGTLIRQEDAAYRLFGGTRLSWPIMRILGQVMLQTVVGRNITINSNGRQVNLNIMGNSVRSRVYRMYLLAKWHYSPGLSTELKTKLKSYLSRQFQDGLVLGLTNAFTVNYPRRTEVFETTTLITLNTFWEITVMPDQAVFMQ